MSEYKREQQAKAALSRWKNKSGDENSAGEATRDSVYQTLRAAGILSQSTGQKRRELYLSPEALERIGQVPVGTRSVTDLIEEDRGVS